MLHFFCRNLPSIVVFRLPIYYLHNWIWKSFICMKATLSSRKESWLGQLSSSSSSESTMRTPEDVDGASSVVDEDEAWLKPRFVLPDTFKFSSLKWKQFLLLKLSQYHARTTPRKKVTIKNREKGEKQKGERKREK